MPTSTEPLSTDSPARQQSAITLTTFAAIGAGMALPYLILSLRPGMLAKVPRTGPASNVLKQVMGLLMLAVAVFFLGIPIAGALRQAPAPASRDYWWGVAALAKALELTFFPELLEVRTVIGT